MTFLFLMVGLLAVGWTAILYGHDAWSNLLCVARRTPERASPKSPCIPFLLQILEDCFIAPNSNHQLRLAHALLSSFAISVQAFPEIRFIRFKDTVY